MMAETIRLPVTAQEVMGFSHQQRVELAETVAGLLASAEIERLMAVILFGSVTRAQDRPASDIDLLITYDGDTDGPDFMAVVMAVAQQLIGDGVPISCVWDRKKATAGTISLAFEADKVYRDPMGCWGWAFPKMGLEEMNFLVSVKKSGRELWRKD